MFWFRRLCLLFLPLPTFVFAAGYVFGQSEVPPLRGLFRFFMFPQGSAALHSFS